MEKGIILHVGKNILQFPYSLRDTVFPEKKTFDDFENFVKMLLRLLTSNVDSSFKLFPVKLKDS